MNLGKLRELRYEVTLKEKEFKVTVGGAPNFAAHARMCKARYDYQNACKDYIEYMLDKHPETVEEAEQELGRYLAQQGLT